MPIRRELAEAAVDRLAEPLGLERLETALGIVQVASAVIVKAIRTISVERGHDPGEFALFAFGGAGPLHAPDIVRELGIGRVIVPPNPGILCAEGLLGSDLIADFVQATLLRFDEAGPEKLNTARESLVAQAADWFRREDVADGDRLMAWSVDMRFVGQNFELTVPFDGEPFDPARAATLRADFYTAHDRAYGFALEDEPIEIVSMRVRLTGLLPKPTLPELEPGDPGAPVAERRVAFASADWHATPVYRRADLARDQTLDGPAIVEQMDSTVLLFPDDTGHVDAWGNLVIDLNNGTKAKWP